MADSGKSGENWWGFKLVTSYPRREIVWESGKRISDIEGLKAGGQIIIEMVDPFFTSKGKGKARDVGSDDDGYVTEESD